MKTKQKILFKLIKQLILDHPYLVVIVLHEYFRNLYPSDSHINFKIKDPIKRINLVQDKLITVCQNLLNSGHYQINFKKQKEIEFKKKTGKVYEEFWKAFSKE